MMLWFEELSQIAERSRRSTVQVASSGGGGSGVIWPGDGLIVTNAHVARSSSGQIRLSDGTSVRVRTLARDPQLDLALIEADVGDLPSAVIADSDLLRAGELVLAVGNPYGHAGAVSVGMIHTGDTRRWIQADLRLAPGNSGGPLVDAQGRVTGINTMVANGLALAIPSNIVQRFVARRGRPVPRLGITVEPVNARGFGLLVIEIELASPAENAGLMAGDILTGSAGRPFESRFDLPALLDSTGGAIQLDLLRGGRPESCEVRFEPVPAGVEVG